MNKKEISIVLVHILDKYDVSLYGFLAPLMASAFFPGHDFVVQLILIYSTSFITFFSHPCGAFLFGMLAYRYDPLLALSYSIIGVAVSTLLIGCIPGYDVIGWYAPLSLVVVRCVRGICAAGESTVAKLFIMENKTDKEALRISQWYQIASMMGILLASWCTSYVIGLDFYLWRWCFVSAGITAFFALYIRRRASCAYTMCHGYTYEHVALLWQERFNVSRVAVVTVFSHITYSLPFVFMNSFVPLVTDISFSTMMKYNTMLLCFDMVAVPMIGYMTQHCTAAWVMMCASAVLSFTIIPLFYGLHGASVYYVLGVRMWIVLWGVVFMCPLTLWCRRLFKKREAYFLLGMGNALGAATLGHATTPVCLWLWYATSCVYAPAVYCAFIMVMVVCVVCKTQPVVHQYH